MKSPRAIRSTAKGYDGSAICAVVESFGRAPHIRTQDEEEKAFKEQEGFTVRCRVGERTHFWMNRFRSALSADLNPPEKRWSKVKNHLSAVGGTPPPRGAASGVLFFPLLQSAAGR